MEGDGDLRPVVNALSVCLGAVTLTAVVVICASAMASTPNASRVAYRAARLADRDARLADRDCEDFNRQDEAQQFFENHNPQQDPHGLDADNDGVACEDLPKGGGGGGGGGRDFIFFHKGHVLGAPDSNVDFIVMGQGSKPRKETNGVVEKVPTRCTHINTGEARTGSLNSAFFLENKRIIDKQFHISKSGGVFWDGPGGFDSGGEFEVSGRVKKNGKRAEGKFTASGIVNGKWDCTTGRVRWRTEVTSSTAS